jgi:hypothetical protein
MNRLPTLQRLDRRRGHASAADAPDRMHFARALHCAKSEA